MMDLRLSLTVYIVVQVDGGYTSNWNTILRLGARLNHLVQYLAFLQLVHALTCYESLRIGSVYSLHPKRRVLTLNL